MKPKRAHKRIEKIIIDPTLPPFEEVDLDTQLPEDSRARHLGESFPPVIKILGQVSYFVAVAMCFNMVLVEIMILLVFSF